MTQQLKRTPLHGQHRQLGGKLVPFAGFEMPVQYPSGILAEHQAVRQGAGIFDVSHMGEVEVRGAEALDLVQRIATNDASTLVVGQAQYSAMLNERGGVIDDCIVYRFPDHYLVVVNASNQDEDLAWIRRHAEVFDALVIDRSDETGLLALQGPAASKILASVTDADLDGIAYYHFAMGTVAGVPAVISRTGYTGEDGFELYLPAAETEAIWCALLEAGKDSGLIPAGLGARDSLRLEVGYALHGNDVDQDHTPLEAGLGWIVKMGKGDFIGRDALATQKEQGLSRRLVGFTMKERAIPRHGYEIQQDGRVVGIVTSGGHSPTLEIGIGLGYVETAAAKAGTAIDVMVRGRALPAEIVRPPFYTQGSVRK
jgi:aminomethyltransferase